MSSTSRSSVCIIGAGASGLVSLKVFLEREELWDPIAFEEREAIGGIWWVTADSVLFRSFAIRLLQLHSQLQ